MRLLSDSELMDFIAAGSLAAFAAYCRRKLPIILAQACRASGCPHQASAIARHVLLEIWEGAPFWNWRRDLMDPWIEAMINLAAEGGLGPLAAGTAGRDLLSEVLVLALERPQARPPGAWARIRAALGLDQGAPKILTGLRRDAIRLGV